MEKQTIVLHERIAIGISACCMGCPVRYNAKGFDLLSRLGREKGDYKWCPVCPESMAGLGVPREPIHVGGGTGAMVWTGEATVKNRGGRDVTDKVEVAEIEAIRAGILDKLREPSTTRRITNSLWKHYSHYRKVSGKSIPDIHSPDTLRNITSVAGEVLLMERKALEEDVLNGTSPVLYRQKQRRTAVVE